MERVYSAFFTTDRSKKPLQEKKKQQQKPQLTAEALEKHNETQEKLSHGGPLDTRASQIDAVLVHYDGDADDDDDDAGVKAGGADGNGGDARRKKGRSGEHVAAHRRELTQLTLNYLEIKRDLKSAFKAALRGM